jgi:ketosteroid isomerase-like protein
MSNTINQAGEICPASTQAELVLSDVQERWNRAAKNWDVASLTAMYTEDALMYGGRPGMSIGHAGMNEYFASYADMLSSTRLNLTEQFLIELAPDVYLAQGYGVFEFKLINGKVSGTTMRTTLILVKRKSEWRILQHHFSSTPDVPPIPQ